MDRLKDKSVIIMDVARGVADIGDWALLVCAKRRL